MFDPFNSRRFQNGWLQWLLALRELRYANVRSTPDTPGPRDMAAVNLTTSSSLT